MRHTPTLHFFTFLAVEACWFIVLFYGGRWSRSLGVRLNERFCPPEKRLLKRGMCASPNAYWASFATRGCTSLFVILILAIIFRQVVLVFP